MADNKEQRICIKFCFNLGKSADETQDMLQIAFGEDALSRCRTVDWFERFKNGQTSVEDEPRTGRPVTFRSDEYVTLVQSVIMKDGRMTINEVCDKTGLTYGSCQAILTGNLDLKRAHAKLVPRFLTHDQKEVRMRLSSDLFKRAREDRNFLSNIITGGVIWVTGYDPKTLPRKVLKFSRLKNARKIRSSLKVMLIVFFDQEGIVHHDFIPSDQTLDQVYYLGVLSRLLDAIRSKRRQKWSAENWMLHHDHEPVYTAGFVQEFLAEHNISLVQHPPHSPDLAPCDFFLFPKLKIPIKGKGFDDLQVIKANMNEQIKAIPKTEFVQCFQQWQERWAKCAVNGGDYFEND